MPKRYALFILLWALCFAGLAGFPDVPVYAAQDAATLDFGETPVTDWEGLTRTIDSQPDLKAVLLYASKVTTEEISKLTGRYPQIFFGFTIQIAEHTLRTDQTAFSTLHNNRSPEHTSADFEVLKYCTKLEALDLGHNNIDDISFIANLKNLKVLILALNNITDISPLSELDQLEYLELFRNKTRDISPLSGLGNLLDLNLCYNYIKDFSPLYQIKTLERLWLYKSSGYQKSSRIDKDTLTTLKSALPLCYIDSTTYSTGGGWREHPRYFTVFEIFKDGIYRPFDESEKEATP